MCIYSVCYQMLMLHRGHLGTLWVCIEAFDRRYYSKVLPEWMVLRCWCKTSRTIIISHNKILRCILLGQDYFYNMSSWNLPLDCPNLKFMSVYRLQDCLLVFLILFFSNTKSHLFFQWTVWISFSAMKKIMILNIRYCYQWLLFRSKL